MKQDIERLEKKIGELYKLRECDRGSHEWEARLSFGSVPVKYCVHCEKYDFGEKK